MDLKEYRHQIEAETQRLTELWIEFKKKYPKTFGKIEFVNFHVPKGWVGLLREFGQKFEKQFPKVPISQVKQKFAHLRIYPNREALSKLSDEVNADLHALIADFEERALVLCEGCGSSEDIQQTEGYVQRFCPTCKHDYEHSH